MAEVVVAVRAVGAVGDGRARGACRVLGVVELRRGIRGNVDRSARKEDQGVVEEGVRLGPRCEVVCLVVEEEDRRAHESGAVEGVHQDPVELSCASQLLVGSSHSMGSSYDNVNGFTQWWADYWGLVCHVWSETTL